MQRNQAITQVLVTDSFIHGVYACRYNDRYASVDAGWTEPCLRTAIDAVINLCNDTGALFNGGFSMAVYPHYRIQPQASW
ncbi:hypothetical protein DN388_01520 [Pseudomonas sp. S12(2018)]|uniref:hypothetical protein n=1 Tax=Pseudomonas sp. S12(2018) TaxID=2219664 RepID=UPI001E4B11C9|nr:hypothetical protein [Pseudomonas sp. S12(2018)]MCQ0165629.1 hypothetical protein [Pseudomonas sp. S12(2018)]